MWPLYIGKMIWMVVKQNQRAGEWMIEILSKPNGPQSRRQHSGKAAGRTKELLGSILVQCRTLLSTECEELLWGSPNLETRGVYDVVDLNLRPLIRHECLAFN